MFDSLSVRLDKAIKNLKGQGRITEINVATTVKEIRKALIEADVNFKVAKQVTDKIREEALGRDVLAAVSPGQFHIFSSRFDLLLIYLYNAAPLHQHVNAAFVEFCDHFHDGAGIRADLTDALRQGRRLIKEIIFLR